MSLFDQKQRLRKQAYMVRRNEPNKLQHSLQAMERWLSLPVYVNASSALWYVDCRSELRTRQTLSSELQLPKLKTIVVPYCTVDHSGNPCLGLWKLHSIDELVTGAWQIQEPPRERQQEANRLVLPNQLDVVMVPGVAFSRQGDRLGSGQGYYDRLLRKLRPDCATVGVCYESQLRDDLVHEPHDMRVQQIVTESQVYKVYP